MNYGASLVYPHGARLEEGGFATCFNDRRDLMCAARVGKGGRVIQIAGAKEDQTDKKTRHLSGAIFQIDFRKTVDRHQEEGNLTRGRLEQMRVCVYRVNNNALSSSTSMVGEAIATMMWECVVFQTDIIAGEGNKACYVHPKNKERGMSLKYEQSPAVLASTFCEQRAAVTIEALREAGSSSSVQVKSFISAPYEELKFVEEEFDGLGY